jgi:predicted PurR-regulated permease PerM
MSARPRPNSALFTLAALVTAVAALYFAREILLPVALAIFVSFLLAPLAERLERVGLGRIPSVLAVVSVAFCVLGLLGWVVTSQLVDLSSQLPQYRENIIAKVRAVTHGSETLKGVTDTIEDVTRELTAEDQVAEDQVPNDRGAERGDAAASTDRQREPAATAGRAAGQGGAKASEPTVAEQFAALADRVLGPGRALQGADDAAVSVKVISMPPSPLSQMQTWLGPLMAPLTAAGMVVVLVLFMLLQREDQRNRLIRLFGASNIRATTEALTDIVTRVSKYLRMQFIINAGYGACVGAGLALIGLPNAVMFGVLSFSLRFLPYIGPWISAALPVAVAIAVTDGWTSVLLVVGWFVILELLVNNVAEPLLYGSSTGVSGMGVIVAAIFWTWIWGAVGLVLAMPLTVCLVVMARYIPALRFITVMLGDQPPLSLAERIYQRMLVLDVDEVRELADHSLADATPTEFYDRVLIPALLLAERDRHAGALSEDQEQAIQESARELIGALGAESHDDELGIDAAAPAAAQRARVLCVPLRGEADKTAAIMVGQLLAEENIEPIVGAVETLTSEMVDAVDSLGVDAVVVSVLPPLAAPTSRLVCRRLRKRYPQLPVLVGYWDGGAGQDAHHQLASKGDAEVFTTLAEVVTRVRAIASRTAVTEPPAAALPCGSA